jgi:hypothetical protein
MPIERDYSDSSPGREQPLMTTPIWSRSTCCLVRFMTGHACLTPVTTACGHPARYTVRLAKQARSLWSSTPRSDWQPRQRYSQCPTSVTRCSGSTAPTPVSHRALSAAIGARKSTADWIVESHFVGLLPVTTCNTACSSRTRPRRPLWLPALRALHGASLSGMEGRKADAERHLKLASSHSISTVRGDTLVH